MSTYLDAATADLIDELVTQALHTGVRAAMALLSGHGYLGDEALGFCAVLGASEIDPLAIAQAGLLHTTTALHERLLANLETDAGSAGAQKAVDELVRAAEELAARFPEEGGDAQE